MATGTRVQQQAQDFVEESFKQASDSFSRTMEAGIRLQEDAVRFWSDIAGKSTEELRTQWERTAGAVPFSRENVTRLQQLIEEQSSKSMETLRQAFDVGRSHNPSEIYDRMLSLWRSSFDTVKNSADSLARMNADMFENWSTIARETGEHAVSAGHKTNGNGAANHRADDNGKSGSAATRRSSRTKTTK